MDDFTATFLNKNGFGVSQAYAWRTVAQPPFSAAARLTLVGIYLFVQSLSNRVGTCFRSMGWLSWKQLFMMGQFEIAESPLDDPSAGAAEGPMTPRPFVPPVAE